MDILGELQKEKNKRKVSENNDILGTLQRQKNKSVPDKTTQSGNGYASVADLNRATNGAGVSPLEQAAQDVAATLPEARTPRTMRTYRDGTTRERQDRGAMLRGAIGPHYDTEGSIASGVQRGLGMAAGAGAAAVDALSGLDYLSSNDRKRIENARKNLETYTANRDVATNEAERQRWQKLADHAQNEINAYTKSSEAKRQNATEAAEALRNTQEGLFREASEGDYAARAGRALETVEKYGDNTYDDNLAGLIGSNYGVGRLSQNSSYAWNEYLNNPTPENRAIAELYDLALSNTGENNADALTPDNGLETWARSIANYAPQFLDQTAARLKGGAAGLLLGNVNAGQAAGSAIDMYAITRGAAFRGLLEAGVPEDQAMEMAKDEALISSIIEYADSVTEYLALGGKDIVKLLMSGGAELATTTAGKSAGRAAAKKIAAYLANIVQEGEEERSQEAVSIANERRLADGTTDSGGLGLARNALGVYWNEGLTGDRESEAYQQMASAAAEGRRIAATFGAIQAGTGYVANRAENRLSTARGMDFISDAMEQADSGEVSNSAASKIFNNEFARDRVQRLGGVTLTDDMTKQEQRDAIKQAAARLAGVGEAEQGAAPTTNDRTRISEPPIPQRMGESGEREAFPLRGVSEQQLDRDLADAARLSVTLGRSGANAFLTAYDRATAASVEPTAAFESFSKVYNAAVRGENAPEVNMPEHLRVAAQGAGENDARAAAQAQYFGENAGLAPDRSGRPRNLSRREARVLDAIGKAAGVQIKFADTMNGANASIENGVLTIAKDADDPVRAAFTHEIVHRVRESAPEAYSALAQFVVDNMSDERLASAIRARSDTYSDMNYNISDITEEAVADAFGRMASEPELLERIAGVDRTAAQKILDAIDELLRKVKAALSGKEQARLTATQIEAFRDLQGRGEEMAKALRAALNKVQAQAQTANKNAATEDGAARYSRKVDSDYMAAVERGDTEEAQRMVDEAAKAAGYTTPKLYHGTRAFGFTEFDTSKTDDGISLFATDNPRTAETYSGETKRNRIKDRSDLNADNLHGNELLDEARKYKKRYNDYKLMSEKDKATVMEDSRDAIKGSRRLAEDFIKEHNGAFDEEKMAIMDRVLDALSELSEAIDEDAVQSAYDKYNDAIWDLKWIDDDIALELVADIDNRGLMQDKNTLSDMMYGGDLYADWYFGGPDYVFDNQLQIEINAELNKGVYELYGRPDKQLVIDADGSNWNQIKPPEELNLYGPQRTRDIASAAKAAGYDSVLFKRLRDNGGETAYNGESNVYIFFRPDALKSADPVTYDDNGDVIPPSERFNKKSPDIRYSRNVDKERIFRTPQGVEVVQNPTESEYAQMRSEVYKAYPWMRETGEPPLRYTYDEDGNKYYWSSVDALHYQVEPYINREFNTRTSQHWKWWEQPDKDDYPTRYSRKSVADAEAREAALLQENGLLREEIKYWKAQLERTPQENVGIVDPNAVRKTARKLIADYGSTLAQDDITNELQDLYNLMGTGSDERGELSYDSAREIADSVARKIAENAVDDTESAYRMYEDLRSFLRTMDLTVTAAETAEIGDWGDWRKQNFGRMQVKRGETSNIDRIYDELSDRWPEFFPGDVLTVGDQLNRIAEVADYLYRDRGHNPYDPYMDQAVIDIGNDIMERFFDLPQAKTFADKQAAKLETLRVQMSELRARDSKRLQRSLAKVRESRDRQIERMTERFRAKTEAGREKQSVAKLRKQIMRHTSALSQKLLRPTDKQHIPDSLRTPVAAMLEAINKESAYDIVTDENGRSKRVTRGEGDVLTKRTQAFAELKKRYAEMKDDENLVIDPDLLGDEAAGFQGLFDQVLAMSGTPIQRMSTEQLQTIWKVVRAVEHSVSTYGKTLSAAKFKTTADWAFRFRDNTKDRKDRATIGGKDISLGLENPYTFFSQYGESGKAIFRMLRAAQDTQRRRMDRIADAVHSIADSKTVKELRETRHEFTTERGDTLTLTTAQIMELYNLTKREQAQNHLLKGGIVQPEIPAAGKQKRIERGTDMIRLTQADLGELAALLTPKQTDIADALQQLTATALAEWGNEASMAAYGYRKFTERNYWPIHTAQEALHSKVENNRSNPRSIKNIGMAKALVPNASNAVSVGDVFTTFAEHAADIIDYSSWLLPMEDANRLFNFKYKGDDGYPASTFKQELDRVGGRNGKAQKYWTDLMADIQNGLDRTSRSDLEGLAAKGIGNVKGASVGANLRVIVQQPTAYLRANAVMNPESLTKGLIGGVTRGNGWQKAQQYAAIARIKDVGGFDQGSTQSVSNELYSDRTALEKVGDIAGRPAGKADAVTWGALWNAAEWETKRMHPDIAEGSAAFYQKTAEIFTDTIDQTQVVDGVLQRSAIMRSGDRLTQQITAFMGEPIMALNLMLRSYDNVRYAKTKEQRGAAIRQLGRAAVTLAVTDLVNSAVQSLVDALRKDDKDKDYWDRFMTALTGLEGDEKTAAERLKNIYLEGNFADNTSLIGRIPLAKDLRSILQGFTVERLDAGAISDLMQSAQQLASGKYAPVYGAYRVAEQAAKIVGIPATNLERDAHGIVRSIFYATGDPKLIYEYEKAIFNSHSTKNKSRFFDTAYMALEQGDTATYETIRNDLVDKMGVSAKDVDDNMKSRYNKAVKEDGAYILPQAAADMLALRQKYSVKTETEEEKFKAEYLGAAAYTRYSNQRARDYKTYKDALEKTTEFRKLSAEDKDRAMNWAYSLADEMALEENSDGQYKMTDKWKTTAKDAKRYGISMTNYLTFHMVEETTSSTRDKDGKEVKGQKKADKLRDWLENRRGLTDGQRAWLWGTVYSSEW